MSIDNTILVLALGAALAGFAQGLSGFGFGLVAMSVWAWTIDPKLAAVMSVFGALTGQILTAFTVRRAFNIKQVLPFVIGGLMGIPIGIIILPHLNIYLFKLVLGILLVIWCPSMLFSSYLPKLVINNYKIERIIESFIGIVGGVMSALGGFTGVIPTLWCTVRGYPKDEQRALIQNFNLTILSVTMITYITKGNITQDMLPYFAIIAPAMLIPNLLGSRLYKGISDILFRKIVLSLLTASGITLLISAFNKLY
jgi:uncharacterized membrane protein YfcA